MTKTMTLPVKWLVQRIGIPLAICAVSALAAPAFAGTHDLSPEMQSHLDSLPDDNLRVEYLTDQLKDHPDDVTLLFHLGNLYYDMNKMSDAIEQFQKVVEKEPDFVGALVNLGGAYDELGRLDEALTTYRKALALAPNEDRTLCNIGGVYFRKRQYEKAIDSFQKALKADPKSQLAHYNMAILFADSQIYNEAINEWQACVDIDSTSDLGQRSKQNIGIIHEMLTAKTPELNDSGS